MSPLVQHLRSNVVAYLALAIAMGGTSYAAVALPKDSVGAKQIQSSAVRSAEVKNGSLKAADFKAGQLPAGPQGIQGPQGSQGDPGADALAVVVPTVRVRLAAGQALADNAGVSIPWDSEVYDASDMHDPANPTRLTAPIAGVYLITATVNWNEDAQGSRYVEIRKNGAVNSSAAGSIAAAVTGLPTVQNISGEVRLAAGEFVTVRGQVFAAGNSLVLAGNPDDPITFATMSFVSP